MKLQTIQYPSESICNEESLYIQREGEWISFGGYFNLFYLEKHHRYCNIDKLTLELKVRGISSIKIMHDRNVVSEVNVESFDTGYNRIRRALGKGRFSGEDKNTDVLDVSIELPYDKYDKGVFYFKALISDPEKWSIKGAYYGTAEKYNPVEVAVNICTYRREMYVLRNMKNLISYAKEHGEEAFDKLHVFIVDNGRTLLENRELERIISDNRFIEVIPNANTGGAGGFKRGMEEAIKRREELSLSHLLMMDDDAVFDPDLFVRLYGFLSVLKDEFKEITVGGSLMREDYQYIQHAAGEWFSNYKVINEHPLVDLRTFDACTSEFMTGTEKEHQLYGAWWCCCYSMNAITSENLPLPIFVHHDDIQFGMGQTERGIVFLNGIGVWHQGFETSFPGVKQYYNMRNTLITMQMYEPEKLRNSMLKWTVRRYIGMLINYRYADCEFVYRGFMDFLKGKEWLLNSDPEAIHKELILEYKRICPMRSLTPEEKALVDQSKIDLSPDNLREYYNSDRFEGTTCKKLTFNGWFLPGKRTLKVVTPLDTPWATYRQKQILLYEPATERGVVVKRDNKEFSKGMKRLMEMRKAASEWKKHNKT